MDAEEKIENNQEINFVEDQTIVKTPSVKFILTFIAILVIVVFLAIRLATAFGFTQTLNQSNVNYNVTTEPNNVSHLSIDNTQDPYSSIVSYYAFDGDLTNRTAYDYSANSRDGTYMNVQLNTSGGLFGSYANFSGNDGEINLGRINLTGSNFTICTWVKPFTVTGSQWLINQWASSDGIALFNIDQSLIFEVGAFQDRIFTNNSYQINQWQHICVTKANAVLGAFPTANLTIFYNGVILESSINTITKVDVYNMSISHEAVGGVNTLKGYEDEVIIFNKSLSLAQIRDIYQNKSKRFFQAGNIQTPTITIGTGNNTVNVSVDNVATNLSSNVSIRIYDGTSYSNYQNITQKTNTTHTISSSATSIFANITLIATNNSFYSPLVYNSVRYDVYSAGDNAKPLFSNISVNNSNPQILDNVLFSVYWTDNVGLAGYIFGWNATGVGCDTFGNDSYALMTGTGNWSNVTKQVPATCLLANVGKIGWYVWANDTSGNANMTSIQLSFAPITNSCTYTSGTWIINMGDFCNITTNQDVAGNSIILNGTSDNTGWLRFVGANITSARNISSYRLSNVFSYNGGFFTK